MTSVVIRPFGGLTPRVAKQLLPDLGAQQAINCILTSGEVRPTRAPSFITATVNPSAPSIFRCEYQGAEKWLDWSKDVDCVLVPLPVDVEPRYIWTGDGEPRYGKYSTLPATYYALGTPTPQTAPRVTTTGGTGVDETRLYKWTLVASEGGMLLEGAPSPVSQIVTGKPNGTWTINCMDVIPVNSGNASGTYGAPSTTFKTYAASGLAVSGASNATPIVASTSATNSYADGDLVEISGVVGNTAANGYWVVKPLTGTTFELYNPTTHAPVAGNGTYTSGGTSTRRPYHWLRQYDEVVINGVTMPVTSVPNPYTFTVAGNYSAYTTWARKANWNVSGMTRSLYRTTGTNAAFQLVAENLTTTSYTDTLSATQIPGDDLMTEGWVPPPANLKGIFVMPDGSVAGYAGNVLHRSEPYQPHAWLVDYQRQTDYEIIGAASFGTTIVIATAANPYVAEGVEPGSVTLQRIDKVWPCLSKRSVLSIGDAVLYATKDGLAYIGQTGAALWTKDLYTVEEWFPLNPHTMIATMAQEKVFLAYTKTGSAPQMLVFSPNEPLVLTELSLAAVELYADLRNGQLYFVDATGIKQWNTGAGSFMTWTWQSKDYRLAKKVNFGAIKIDFASAFGFTDSSAASDAYQATLSSNQTLIGTGNITHDYGDYAFGDIPAVGDDNLTTPDENGVDKLYLTVYSNMEEQFTKLITDTEPFSLPAGYKSDNYSFKTTGTVRLLSIKVAETMAGLMEI